MKIIKKVDVSGWSRPHTCTKCDSQLEVEKGDLIYYYYAGDQRDPSYESFSAKCPVCNDSFCVPNDAIPKIIRLEVKAKGASSTSSGAYYDR
jgi:hypothetical protein